MSVSGQIPDDQVSARSFTSNNMATKIYHQAFEVLRHALSQASDEEKVVINSCELAIVFLAANEIPADTHASAEHYGVAPHFTNNLQMLSRFFTKYPDLQQKAFLVVKVGLN